MAESAIVSVVPHPHDMRMVTSSVRSLLRILLPLPCASCGARSESGLCHACRAALVSDVGSVPVAWPHRLIACVRYEGPAKHVVLAAKRTGSHALVEEMARAVATKIPSDALVTWIPTSASRRRRRGYDHAELLARRAASLAGVPAVPMLRRLSDAQEGKGRAARADVRFGLLWSPDASWSSLRGRTVVVVDDVRTTGSTLRCALAVIASKKPREIIGLTYAAADSTR